MSRPLLAPVLLSAVLALGGCASATTPADDLAELTRWMTGTFDSSAQAAADPDGYRAVRLVTMPIWEEREDGPWLYVEQAVVGAEERPYRQRVYRLRMRGVDELESEVFELPENPLGFAGAWRDPGVFRTCAPEDLEPRFGCSIFLRRRSDGAFAGETRGTRCASRLAGAEYATSEVVITRDVLRSWDRGFDADGAQVWGAERGPYEFRRVSSGFPGR